MPDLRERVGEKQTRKEGVLRGWTHDDRRLVIAMLLLAAAASWPILGYFWGF